MIKLVYFCRKFFYEKTHFIKLAPLFAFAKCSKLRAEFSLIWDLQAHIKEQEATKKD